MARRSHSNSSATRTHSPGTSPLLWAAIIGAILEIGLVSVAFVPLGIPGEWTWQRIPANGTLIGSLVLSALTALPAGLLYLVACYFGGKAIEAARTTGRCWRLLLLGAAAFVWLWCLIQANPDPLHRLSRGPIVQYYPAFSGYFRLARRPDDFRVALAGYEERMAAGDVLHIGTHPPGLIIAQRGLLSLFRASPALASWVLASRPESVRKTEHKVIAAFPLAEGRPLTKADLATLWAAALLIMLAAVLTLLPLYALGAAAFGARAGWRLACFWPLVPAVVVFFPKSDVLLALLGTTCLACWWPGERRGALRSLLAGLLFWVGMLTSLAMLVVGGLLFCLTVAEVLNAPANERRSRSTRTLGQIAMAGGTFAAATALFWLVADVNLLDVWWTNYENHAGFYEQYPRTYWKWLLLNPLVLALALGLPIVAATGAGFRKVDWRSSPALPVLLTIALVWISGKNSGEAARLWLPMMPWVLWCGGAIWQKVEEDGIWLGVLASQVATTIVVSARVSGFEFQRFLS